MAARNCIELSIPLALSNGSTIRTQHCKLTADFIDGYTDDSITTGDEILLDFVISSAAKATQTTRKMYHVTHAHPESCDGNPCTWFMAVPQGAQA
jgi:hypothetical protein